MGCGASSAEMTEVEGARTKKESREINLKDMTMSQHIRKKRTETSDGRTEEKKLTPEQLQQLKKNPQKWADKEIWMYSKNEFWLHYTKGNDYMSYRNLHSLVKDCVLEYLKLVEGAEKASHPDASKKELLEYVVLVLGTYLPGSKPNSIISRITAYFAQQLDKSGDGKISKMFFWIQWGPLYESLFEFGPVSAKRTKYLKKIKKVNVKKVLGKKFGKEEKLKSDKQEYLRQLNSMRVKKTGNGTEVEKAKEGENSIEDTEQ